MINAGVVVFSGVGSPVTLLRYAPTSENPIADFISEYVWSTVCTRKQKMEAYYRAQDQNVAMLIKEFDYTLSVEVEHIRNDIWKT